MSIGKLDKIYKNLGRINILKRLTRVNGRVAQLVDLFLKETMQGKSYLQYK